MISFKNDKIPAKGYILACYDDGIIFEPYEMKNGAPVFAGSESHTSSGILRECHLFDEDTEYRMVYREATDEKIEIVLTRQEEDSMDKDLLFTENILVQDTYADTGRVPKTLTIVNRYTYSDYDTLTLKNYRISAKLP